jgi:acyl transferase domain-containing protein
VFDPSRATERPLIISSVWSSIGNADPAAGINGLINTTSIRRVRLPFLKKL